MNQQFSVFLGLIHSAIYHTIAGPLAEAQLKKTIRDNSSVVRIWCQSGGRREKSMFTKWKAADFNLAWSTDDGIHLPACGKKHIKW